jgi:hypothetical protein
MPMTAYQSAVTDHAVVTADPVPGAVAPALLPAAELELRLSMYRDVSGDVALVMPCPFAQNAMMRPVAVLVPELAVGVPAPAAEKAVPHPPPPPVQEMEPPVRSAVPPDSVATIEPPDGLSMRQAVRNPAVPLLVWTVGPTFVIAAPPQVTPEMDRPASEDAPTAMPTRRLVSEPPSECDQDSELAAAADAPAELGPTALNAATTPRLRSGHEEEARGQFSP